MKQKLADAVSKVFVVYYKIIYGKHVDFGHNVIINHKFRLRGRGKLIIGNRCNLWAFEEPNKFFLYDASAEITVGEGSRVNGVTVHCRKKVSLGKNCIVGSAIILDTDFHKFKDPKHILYGAQTTKPVAVGDNVWLCGQSVLLKGSVVGNGSVVGFRSVVTKKFPSNVVIAGNPAKVVRAVKSKNT